MVEELEKAGIEYREYKNGQINAKDLEGVIHTFYSTTGTVVLHAGNDKYENRTKVFRDKTIEQFAKALKFKNLVEYYFKED